MKLLPLYDLDEQYQELADLSLEAPEEQAPAPEELLHAVEAIEDDAGRKVLALAKVVRSLEAEAQLLEEHGRMMLGKASNRRRRMEFLKRWVQLQMEGAGLDRLRDPFVTVWLQASPPSVEILDDTAVPGELRRAVLRLPYSMVPTHLHGYLQHLDVDRAGILELAKRAGEVPPGVRIRTAERHIRIR